MSRPSLLNLETALWVARLGSFSAAARKLNATQPAVSFRIKELETGLGAALFERRGRRMEPTVRGREFLQRMEPLIEGVQNALAEFDDPHLATGIVRIGSGDIPMIWTSALIRRLQQLMPRVTYEVQIGIASSMLRLLEDGQLDLVAVAKQSIHPTLQFTPLGQTPMVWVAGRDRWRQHGVGPSPRDVAELINHGPIWLVPRASRYHDKRIGELKAAGAHLRNICTCDNMATQIQLVSEGGGIGFLPESLIGTRFDSGELVPLFPRQAPVMAEYALVYEAARLQSTVRRIIELAAEHPFAP